ncbi:hypothetical protein B0H12DRAFT_1076983 [Mycena haematopus]|nr:hypothetical protein B0H12DRAFT_1076983 [Mycena haematopus]
MDVDNTPTRVEELWFSDGSLVVQAEQSLFRVSRAILAARSPVFNDMLAFTPPSDAETIDGFPVVRLPDSAEDVTCFFRAIFDSSFFEPYPYKVSFEDALSITRLSHKYAVDYLLRRGLAHLSQEFPTTLSDYETESITTNFRDIVENDDAISSLRDKSMRYGCCLSFYMLASADKETLGEVLGCEMFKHHAAKLSADDIILFIRGNVLLARQENEALNFLHSADRDAECTGGNECNTSRSSAFTQAQNFIASGAPDPLNVCFRACIWGVLWEGCCTECYKCLKKVHDQARQRIWDKLPVIFELPPWLELEKMKADALAA